MQKKHYRNISGPRGQATAAAPEGAQLVHEGMDRTRDYIELGDGEGGWQDQKENTPGIPHREPQSTPCQTNCRNAVYMQKILIMCNEFDGERTERL